MTPAVRRGIADEQNLEKQIAKQMGCMAGFLQLFDRHQILAAKRLPSSPALSSTSPSEISDGPPSLFLEDQRRSLPPEPRPSSPENSAPAASPARQMLPLPLPVFESKERIKSSWKLREAPRLSLDSRAIVDAKGKLCPREIRTTPAIFSGSNNSDAAEENDKQRRSPSVVARLMGLEALPNSGEGEEPFKRAELLRSASESRVSREYRFVDGSSFQHKPPPEIAISAEEIFRFGAPDLKEKLEPPPRTSASSLQRKSFFDAQDFFPEPKRTGSLYGEIERRLRMRGIDEPAKDLEALKQILEALQLKGLLHSKPQEHQINGRNVIYDHRSRSSGESPIVIMKPGPRTSASPPLRSRSGSTRRNLASDTLPPARVRRDRGEIDRNLRCNERNPRSPDRSESARSPSSLARRQPLNTTRSIQPQRRISPVHSPKNSPKKVGSDPLAIRSPRNRKPMDGVSPKERVCIPAEDDTSSISESAISTSSQFDIERYRAGKSLLERCDKLLHSIAEITSAEQVTAEEPQPSPVSVLDSSFYCDESSPSPVMNRSIDSKDQSAELEEDLWNQAMWTVRSKPGDEPEMDDQDFVYVSEILRASDHRRSSDVFAMLEKRDQDCNSSKASKLHRRLVFDTVAEILERKRHVSPWDPFSHARSPIGRPLLRHVWLELQRIREQVPADDLNDVTCGVIRKDMVGDHGWGDPTAEISDAVLYIERLIFKDLVAESIRDLAGLVLVGNTRPLVPRRKLMF